MKIGDHLNPLFIFIFYVNNIYNIIKYFCYILYLCYILILMLYICFMLIAYLFYFNNIHTVVSKGFDFANYNEAKMKIIKSCLSKKENSGI